MDGGAGLRVAFGGRARSGKTTAVSYLSKKYGGVELSFSDPLYDILHYAQEVCGFPRQKDRAFLQYVGTDWARARDPDVWVHAMTRRVEVHKTANVWVGDVRFPNELDVLRQAGFVLCLIVRRGAVHDDSFGSGSRTHASEVAMDSVPNDAWDVVIENDGSLEDLYQRLDAIVCSE